MSIEKLNDQSRIRLQSKPFTQICNEVILGIKDNDAFRVYCYLSSKSENWKVIKQNIKNVIGVGDRKLKQIFSYLRRANLIRYAQIFDKNKYSGVDVIVLSGLDFDSNEPFISNKEHVDSKDAQIHAGSIPARAESSTCGNDELLNKETTKQRKITKQYCASNDDAIDRFDQFWNIYPKKKDKLRAKRLWSKLKLDDKADMIIADVAHRTVIDAQWQNAQFIPHASTYLNGQRWEDEISKEIRKPFKQETARPQPKFFKEEHKTVSRSTEYS